MQTISDIQARLEATPRAADSLADTLVVALDGFGALLECCRAAQDQSVALFPAFAFAAAAAAKGRHIVLTAPSLPALGRVTGAALGVQGDHEIVADALAGLAGALSGHLAAAARQARDPGDRDACHAAAEQAGQVRALLARDG